MRKDNTQNYQTSNTKVQHFSDFTDNVESEKDELEKIGRSFTKNEDDVHNLPNLTKMKYNKVTNKVDNLSKDEINDRIAALSNKKKHKFKIVDDEINPNHKFQNETDVKEHKHLRSFEGYTGAFGFNNNEFTQKNDMTDEEIEDIDEVDVEIDDEDYSDQMPEDSYDDYQYDESEDESENETEDHEKSYMFFKNLETIHRQVKEMMEMDHHMVDDMLNNGHDWAEDHMSSAKENIEQVYDFLKNKVK